MSPRYRQIFDAFLCPRSSPVKLTSSRVLQARIREKPGFPGRERTLAQAAKMGKENSNEETWGDAGAGSYSRAVSADRHLYPALPRGNRTLGGRTHVHQPSVM